VLVRNKDFFAFLGLDEAARVRGLAAGAERAGTMMDVQDYAALAAVALHVRPRSVFEIGTYRGNTSDFFLALLPECRVTSIAYEDPNGNSIAPPNNDSGLPHAEIGSRVSPERRARFTQLYGNSHDLTAPEMLAAHGHFDLVLIDGDHSHAGVMQDTELARGLIHEQGVICWHDANPNPLYLDVRRYLEQDCPLLALATWDDFIGGIACWSREIEARLR
jgi:predicted O-methyltransferase YrrM